jgi:TldD protein
VFLNSKRNRRIVYRPETAPHSWWTKGGKRISFDSTESIAEEAVKRALKRGGTYADARVQFEDSIGFIISEGMVEEGGSASVLGMGLRVVASGAWGFCSMDGAMSESKLSDLADRAVKLAAQSARGAVSSVDMVPTKPVRTRIIRGSNDFLRAKEFSFESVLEPSKECDRLVRSIGSEIRAFSLSFTVGRFIDTFASSEDSCITQAYDGYLGTVFVVASDLGTTEYYPYDFGGLGDHHEFLDKRLPSLAEGIAIKARNLSKSRSPNKSEVFKTVVIDPGFTGLWIHETLGHPLEADRLLGGKGDPLNAPWTYNAFGKKVADASFNVVDDPSMETPAWHKYDSEGIEAKRKLLVKNGVLSDLIHNRETAKAFQVEPNGGARSPSYRFTPMPRMSNTYVEPGDWTFEEIIQDTKDGIYVVGAMTPVVDGRAYEWKLSSKEAYIISKGELGEMLRGVIVSEVTPDFLISIDALGKDLQMIVIPDCAKGSPIQTLPVGNGGPTIRSKAYISGVA